MKTIVTSLLMLLISVSGFSQDLRRVMDLRGDWKFTIGDNPRWANPDYNDATWEKIRVPSAWEDQGFSGFDGYAWYRTTIDLRNINENNLYLVLGYIDDVDEVYLNGELIGFNGSFPPDFYTAYQSFRKYYIPPQLINKNGKNVIAIRVYDTILEGGIIKGDIGLYTNRNQPLASLLLDGIWKFKEGDNQWWKDVDYLASNWKEIMVPSYWRSLKKYHVEDIAWYRKEFYLPSPLQKDLELVLVLGQIDDFDETYLNGQLIGSTNDGKSLGASTSWREYRIYQIPQGLINKEGLNVLAVRVKDIGGNAGIYNGPLAIVPINSLRQLLNSGD